MNEPSDLILKIGITPSNAPFRISCLRTFLYINAIAEKNAFVGGKSKLIFQIDDTNKRRRLYTNEEIFDFYEKIGILPSKYSEFVKTVQTDLKNECEFFFRKLQEKGFILFFQESNLYAFNIQKYREIYGNQICVKDLIHGKIIFNVNDIVQQSSINIKRSDGTFLYNFSSSIDTIHWNFTHLVRGNDKISSAAFQNMFIIALGYQPPIYLHIPLLLEEKHSRHINARDDFRDLLKKEKISYMSAINYILNTGYGDNSDFYPSIEAFNEQFDIKKLHRSDAHFDFNILKKTYNRFYQNDMSYEQYFNQLKRHLLLSGDSLEVLNYAKIGYCNKLNVEKVILLYKQMKQEHFDEISDDLKERVKKLIGLLKIDYDLTIQQVLKDKDNMKINLQLIKYILCGYREGLSSEIYRQCYSDEEYRKRLEYVRRKL